MILRSPWSNCGCVSGSEGLQRVLWSYTTVHGWHQPNQLYVSEHLMIIMETFSFSHLILYIKMTKQNVHVQPFVYDVLK